MFDPNSSVTSQWATYIPTRRPKFKVHVTKGHATSAIKSVSYISDKPPRRGRFGNDVPEDAQLFRMEDGKWVQVKLKKVYFDKESVIFGE